jgi:hypothetical protein
MPTLYLTKAAGGTELPDIKFKCQALFLTAPIGDQRHPYSEWLNTWQQYITFDNPPNMRIIARTTKYLIHIFSRIEVCATEYQRRKEQSSKKQILCPHVGDEADNTDPSHQNPENHPTTVSLTVCANIYNASISDKIMSPRYNVMQDIIPSNCRLRTIHLQSTDVCQKCHHIDPVIRTSSDYAWSGWSHMEMDVLKSATRYPD